MFSPREVATILAALLFWREENAPHGPDVTRPYLDHFGLADVEPLSIEEIEDLCQRLQKILDADSQNESTDSE